MAKSSYLLRDVSPDALHALKIHAATVGTTLKVLLNQAIEEKAEKVKKLA